MSKEPQPKRSVLEELISELKNEHASIDSQIVHWSEQAEVLRTRQTEIEEALRRLDDTQPEPVV